MNPRTRSRRASSEAFTLVEMLAVIAIMAVLASLLLPAIRKPRELARRASCKSNLHQISVACMMYYGTYNYLPSRHLEVAKPSLTALIEADIAGDMRRVGLGLLYPGYITDGEAFYCPSGHVRGGREAMRSALGWQTGGGGGGVQAPSFSKGHGLTTQATSGTSAGTSGSSFAGASTMGAAKGGGSGKITICHYPPGNPANCHTISISQSALAAHLAHGDTIGPCPPGCGQSGDDDDDDDDDDDGGGGGGCMPVVSATFSCDCMSVTMSSTKDLSNVVLNLEGGSHQKFDNLSGLTGTFRATGSKADLKIGGVWIKSGCNQSGAGPGYGEYVANSNFPDDCECQGQSGSWTPSALGSYMYRGMTTMAGFENALSGRITDGTIQACVMDDNTGDLARILGMTATAGASYYKHDRQGCNILYVDGSVKWLDDPFLQTYIPESALGDAAQYGRIWQLADDHQRR